MRAQRLSAGTALIYGRSGTELVMHGDYAVIDPRISESLSDEPAISGGRVVPLFIIKRGVAQSVSEAQQYLASRKMRPADLEGILQYGAVQIVSQRGFKIVAVNASIHADGKKCIAYIAPHGNGRCLGIQPATEDLDSETWLLCAELKRKKKRKRN